MSSGEGPGRLDPRKAIEEARGSRAPEEAPGGPPERPSRLPAQPIDTRRYQWMIGGFGLVLVFIFSVYLYASSGSATPGVAAGKPIHRFVAPLATSNLNVAANAHPVCNPSRPARRGLNVCGRGPLVITFFATGASPCVQEVDTLQAVSRRFAHIQFAAVAVNANRATTLALVRRHRWTIPVAYDLTGAIGEVYGVEVCPIIELVRPGGIVQARLIGKGWLSPSVLAGQVAQLARASAGGAG